MIVERYVSFEAAQLLEKKGFDGDYSRTYTRNGELKSFDYDIFYPAPTIQTAAEWLRVKKGFYVYAGLDIDYDEDENGVKYYHDPLYYGNIVRTNDGEQMYDGGEMYDQPEYAVEAMIRYCLENLI